MAKKLIICSPQLGISPESNLGGEVYDREIIKEFCCRGVKVLVVLPKNKQYLYHKNLKVYYLPFSFVWPPYLFNLLIIPYLFWLYKKEKFDILRIHSPYFAGLGALFFKLFHPQVPIIATYHHLEEEKPLFDLINKLIIKKWDFIITVSNSTRKELVGKYDLKKKKISTIYNGVSLKFKHKKKRKDLVKKYNLKGKKILLFMGQLEKRKNLGFLLNLALQLVNLNFKLLICGKGGLYQGLSNKTKELKLEDKIIFTGFIPEKEKVDYYNLADIFLFPSIKEGFGMTLIEAVSCGVPSVVSNVSSLKELVINGRTGYLAKLNNINDWKIKIEKLLNNNRLKEKMGKEARKFSQRFSWKKSAKKQIEIYKTHIKK